MKLRLLWGDIIAVAAVLVTAVLLFFMPFITSGPGETLTLTVLRGNTTETHEYNLNEDRTVTVTNNGITLTVVIEDGFVSVSESGCRDKICVNSGKISKDGQTIICAPAGVILRTGGKGGGEVDIVAE